MTIQNKRDRITALIDNIKEHSDRLKESQTLPLLELSVILSKITQLHEETLILKYLCAANQNYLEEEFGISEEKLKEKEIANKNEVSLEEETLIETKKDIEKSEDSVDTIIEATLEGNNNQPEVIETKEQQEESTSQEAEVVNEAEERDEPTHLEKEEPIYKEESAEPKKETISFSGDLKVTLEDVEKGIEMDSKPDLNEAFSEEEDASLSGQLKKQPISDLLTAIGLNERYLYANDLFDGDIDAFKNAVVKLNEAGSAEAAKTYFNSQLKSQYNWGEKNELAEALFQLVERRYQG